MTDLVQLYRDDVVASFVCPYCTAGPGVKCVSDIGITVDYIHDDRSCAYDIAQKRKVEEEDPDSNLWSHAKRELELLGEDEWTTNGYLDMIKVFAKMGHSGGSAGCFIPTLGRLLNYQNLTPLTDDPEEWMHVSEGMWGRPGGIWQSVRRSDAFSNDNGKTYYLLSEGGDDSHREPLHTSQPKGKVA